MLAIGVDIGGTKIGAGVVDDAGTIVAQTRRDTDATDAHSVDQGVVDVCRELMADHQVEAIGLAAPGFVSSDRATVNFTPNCFTDIEKILDKKLACLEAHRSQVAKTNIEDLTILELAVSCANFRGIQARVKYAEAFQSIRLLLNL